MLGKIPLAARRILSLVIDLLEGSEHTGCVETFCVYTKCVMTQFCALAALSIPVSATQTTNCIGEIFPDAPGVNRPLHITHGIRKGLSAPGPPSPALQHG